MGFYKVIASESISDFDVDVTLLKSGQVMWDDYGAAVHVHASSIDEARRKGLRFIRKAQKPYLEEE